MGLRQGSLGKAPAESGVLPVDPCFLHSPVVSQSDHCSTGDLLGSAMGGQQGRGPLKVAIEV